MGLQTQVWHYNRMLRVDERVMMQMYNGGLPKPAMKSNVATRLMSYTSTRHLPGCL
jgi:hypothetical protein